MANDKSGNAENEWHLDKRIPIALIVTIILQSSGAIWWASRTETRLSRVEQTITADGATARLARLEVQIDNVVDMLQRLERRINAPGATFYHGPPLTPRNTAALIDALDEPPSIMER